MYILGLATMTESSAVLLRDGKVVAAAEEERFTRVKHDGGFPYRAIDFVLESEGINIEGVDHVAVYWNPLKLGYRGRYMLQLFLKQPTLFFEKLRRAREIWRGAAGEDSGWGTLFKTSTKLRSHLGKRPRNLRFFDHHMCHMASCFYASPFKESAILIMDGAGEAACTTWGSGRGTQISKLSEHRLPHSLGHFYSAVTGYLGFKMLDGEYKLMGLSPYGDPSGAKWIREHFLLSTGSGRYSLNNMALDYHRGLRGQFNGIFANHFGPAREQNEAVEFTDRHRDIAASAQRAFEEVVLDMAAELKLRDGSPNLCIAGGCGLNCVANGKILQSGIYERIYVPPVPHDAGGALGAAMLMHVQITGQRPAVVDHAQFGPEFKNEEIASALQSCQELEYVRLEEEELLEKAATKLSEKGVVAWMQGKMEYGPRALGNRSLLADPREDGIRDVLNEKIKKRELFRPFAPSVKAEAAADYFEIDQPSPFMTIIVPVRQSKRSQIPAIVHVDGTARPQTVDQKVNPRYWKLLDAFERKTGVPILLNTSYNIQEPIVCTPVEALKTFASSGMDGLAIGDFWVSRRNLR